jgi:hypothetical protein
MAPNAEIRVRVQPRAKRTEIAGERGGALLVRVTAPPVEGRANDALRLRKLIAKHAGVAPSRVEVVRGTGGRDKVVRVRGVAPAELRRTLGLPLA